MHPFPPPPERPANSLWEHGIALLHRFERFIKFAIVGAGGFLVDFITYWMLAHVVNYYISRAIAMGLACLFSYALNRRWTFQARDTGWLPLVRFALVNACSLGLSLVLLFVFTRLMGMNHIVAFLVSLPFTIVSNYIGYRFWSFKEIN